MLRKPPFDVQAARVREKTSAFSEVAREEELQRR
jgi:hypothetical protein